jgi:hypothetical protein
MNVVSFSTGMLSALTLERVIRAYGKDDTIAVFMDTLFEDEDNYRFMADCEKYLDIEIIKLVEGRTPYEVSRAHHVIPNSRVAPCTGRLKINPFQAWLKTQTQPLTVHIGYDFTEMHRCEPMRRNYEVLGYQVGFPMLWKPIEFRNYQTILRQEWGIEPPRMYSMGYTHANCGGRCVKQGHGDWIRTLINFPERYAQIEAWENDMRKNDINASYAILKTQTKDGSTPLTLTELRERYEAGIMPMLTNLDAASACVICGIGG